MLKCNCSKLFPEVSEGCHSADRCRIDVGRTNSSTNRARALCPPGVPQYLLAGMSNGQSNVRPYAVAPPFDFATQPIYTKNTYGLPVNVEKGVILTEARCVFIQNLSFKCTLMELERLLLTLGFYPVDQKLLMDRRTGVFKGAATAIFGTQEQAHGAARCLDGRVHMGMKLRVRMGKETTAVGQVGPPLIVGSDMCRY